MKSLVILGAGTAGTMMANHLVKKLDKEWRVTIIDPETHHLYQPGLLFLPFGARDEARMIRERGKTLAPDVHWIQQGVQEIIADHKVVVLKDGDRISYDILIIASGSHIHPEMTPGLSDSDAWLRSIFDFYTLSGALALRNALEKFRGGRLVVNINEMPIKCPVAPLEFIFLADAFFQERKMRHKVELVFVTPLDSAFTKPVASKQLGYLLKERNINMVTEYMTAEVDPESKKLFSYDEREVPYDLLVTIPTHTGADFVENSDIGDELAFIPTHRQTLAALDMEDVFVIGDATDLATSKAGSVAHFQAETLNINIQRHIKGQSLLEDFDGHANCFVETGYGKAMLIDFNYDVQPLPGRFPTALGPFSLLEESRINHWGKLAFRSAYWNALLPARPLPLGRHMNMAGKDLDLLPV